MKDYFRQLYIRLLNLNNMKPKFFTSILLFISAYSPLFLILLVKDFDFEKIKFNHCVVSWILVGLILISIILLFATINKIPKGNFHPVIKSVKSRSNEFINYVIPYILSFMGINLGEIADLIGLSIFLLLLFALTHRAKTVFINPLLAIIGYGIYDIEYVWNNKTDSKIILSKVKPEIDKSFYMKSISQYMYIIVQPFNNNENGSKKEA